MLQWQSALNFIPAWILGEHQQNPVLQKISYMKERVCWHQQKFQESTSPLERHFPRKVCHFGSVGCERGSDDWKGERIGLGKRRLIFFPVSGFFTRFWPFSIFCRTLSCSPTVSKVHIKNPNLNSHFNGPKIMLWTSFVIPAELHNALEKDDSNSCKCCNCIPCMYSFSHGLWTSIRNEAHPVQLWTAYSQIMKNTWIEGPAWISNLVITDSKLVQGELVTVILRKVQKKERNRKKTTFT